MWTAVPVFKKPSFCFRRFLFVRAFCLQGNTTKVTFFVKASYANPRSSRESSVWKQTAGGYSPDGPNLVDKEFNRKAGTIEGAGCVYTRYLMVYTSMYSRQKKQDVPIEKAISPKENNDVPQEITSFCLKGVVGTENLEAKVQLRRAFTASCWEAAQGWCLLFGEVGSKQMLKLLVLISWDVDLQTGTWISAKHEEALKRKGHLRVSVVDESQLLL